MTELSPRPPGQDAIKEQLAEIVQGLGDVSEELRAISRGIHPRSCPRAGSAPRCGRWPADRCPVELDVDVPGRLPDRVEVAAYYVVAEALTNTARHAYMRPRSRVSVKAADGHLDLMISDDGAGGADLANGSGLIGLVDRVEAVGGHL